MLFGCTAARKSESTLYKVTLDASQSYVQGGDGKGYITKWEWTKNGSIIGTKPTIAVIEKAGLYVYKLILTDNLGQTTNKSISVTVK